MLASLSFKANYSNRLKLGDKLKPMNCKQCGKEFVSRKVNGDIWTKFCSLNCSGRFRRKPQPKRKRSLLYYHRNKNNLEFKRKRMESGRKTRQKYPALYAAKTAMRKAAKLQQTPKWADLEAIKEFYLNCPKGMHVDHFYPLKGKDVSGLHVLENLQYLSASENCSKSNKMPAAVSKRQP